MTPPMTPHMTAGLKASSVANSEESPAAYNLAVTWESPWQEFWTSLRDFFVGPRPAKDGDFPRERVLRVEWVRGRLPGRAFLASSLWHLAAVLILILPIWGFLPQAERTLAPVQIEVTYFPAQDLPRISLPSAAAKRSVPAKRADNAAKTDGQPGADAHH